MVYIQVNIDACMKLISAAKPLLFLQPNPHPSGSWCLEFNVYRSTYFLTLTQHFFLLTSEHYEKTS